MLWNINLVWSVAEPKLSTDRTDDVAGRNVPYNYCACVSISIRLTAKNPFKYSLLRVIFVSFLASFNPFILYQNSTYGYQRNLVSIILTHLEMGSRKHSYKLRFHEGEKFPHKLSDYQVPQRDYSTELVSILTHEKHPRR